MSETDPARELPPPRAGALALSAWPQRHLAEAVAAGVVVLFVHLLRRPELAISLPGAFNDDGVYLAVGRALAEGRGYHSIHLPGAPVQLKYPPGLPAIFAVLWLLLGDLVRVTMAARALNALLAGVAAALLWWVARRRLALAAPLALLAVAPLALEETVQYWSLAIAEPWFVALSALALVLAYRAGDDAPAPAWRGALVGLTLAAATLLRTQGIVLLGATALALLAERTTRRAGLACLAAGGAPLLAWSLYAAWLRRVGPVSPLPDETSYLAWLPLDRPSRIPAFVGEAVVENGRAYLTAGGRMALDAPGDWIVPASLLALALWGARMGGRRDHVLSLPTLATLLTVLLWPWWQPRFLLPLLPLLGLLTGVALDGLARGAGQGARRVLAGALVAAVALLLVHQVRLRRASAARVRAGTLARFSERRRLRLALAGDFLPLQSRQVALVSRWVAERARPTDVVLVDVPAAVFLWTGRVAVSSAPAESRAARTVFEVPGRYLAERVVGDGARVVVLGAAQQPIAHDLRLVARACPSVFVPEGETSPTGYPAFYRVVPPLDCLRAFLPPPSSVSPAPLARP